MTAPKIHRSEKCEGCGEEIYTVEHLDSEIDEALETFKLRRAGLSEGEIIGLGRPMVFLFLFEGGLTYERHPLLKLTEGEVKQMVKNALKEKLPGWGED